MIPKTTKPTRKPPAEAQLSEGLAQLAAGMDRLIAGMSATREAVQLRGAQTVPLTGQDQRIAFAPTRILGFALRETTGADPAVVKLRDGDAGDVLVPIAVTAGGDAREWWGPGGIATTAGLVVEITGAVEGSVFLGD